MGEAVRSPSGLLPGRAADGPLPAPWSTQPMSGMKSRPLKNLEKIGKITCESDLICSRESFLTTIIFFFPLLLNFTG